MVNVSIINRLARGVDLIEQRSQRNRLWVVTVRREIKEIPNAAMDRQFAAHPEDRGADVLIWHFYDEKIAEPCRASAI